MSSRDSDIVIYYIRAFKVVSRTKQGYFHNPSQLTWNIAGKKNRETTTLVV